MAEATKSFADRARVLAPVGLGIVVLVIWQSASLLGLVPQQFLPSPIDLADRLWGDLARGELLAYAWVTLGEAITGSLIAVCIAVPVGYLVARIAIVDYALTPYVAASQAVPAIALAPLLVLWVGYGLFPIAILCAITAFFPMLITTSLGVRGLPQDVLEAARLDGANAWQSLWHIEAPLALPSVLAGVRGGAALSITGAVVGEFTMGGNGLGMLLTLYQGANDVVGLFSTLTVLVVLAVSLFTVLRLLEAWVVWRQNRSRGRTSDAITASIPVVGR
ncbi:riboflavin transport system permease protein RibX [Pseudoclavibacter endophyticus]|uniref:ABC transporter permease n=1 Tax=Pseudoclavibacter endophyticus TaxID=1778590 RepID=A0A6H9WRV9_9MICO|nr:ABC transporter permease [Pseudoclavibacter endophyticus]KAB1649044.1 ABC transporter permease [Pseudoclavibacter endophyticus]GGA65934.1 riboflavin transport system permease protein RibX [Pseudoclavibacter endophyticus]